MAQVLTQYQTADGKKFDSAQAADAHEAVLAHAERIEHFLDTQGYPKPPAGQKGGASRGIAKKAIGAWIAYNTPAAQPVEEPTL